MRLFKAQKTSGAVCRDRPVWTKTDDGAESVSPVNDVSVDPDEQFGKEGNIMRNQEMTSTDSLHS